MTLGESRLPRLDRLTSLRFFAALVVVVHHTTRDLAQIPGVTALSSLGTAGVGFFFMLSGFVLTWSARDGDAKASFYRRRFARVYPLHFTTLLLAFPVLWLVGRQPTVGEVLTNATLVQAWVPNQGIFYGMNSPSWSLSAEAFFYLLFPFIIAPLRRLGSGAIWASIAGLLLAMIAVSSLVTAGIGAEAASGFALYVLPPYRVLGFVIGCCAALIVARGFRLRLPVARATGLLLVAFGGVFALSRLAGGLGHGIEDALLAPFILLLILAAATADLAGNPGFLTWRSFVRLGEWSFALYLTHWLLLQLAVHFDPAANTRPVLVRVGEDTVFILAAIALSAAAYHAIEKPMERRLRGTRPRPEKQVAASGRRMADKV